MGEEWGERGREVPVCEGFGGRVRGDDLVV